VANGLLPPQPFLGAILTRAAVLWIVLRIALTIGSTGGAGGEANPLVLGTLLSSVSIVIIATVLWIEMARRGESVFLANLGYSFRHTILIVSVQCVTFEIVLGLIRG
jgi:hypothetical protein